MVNCSSVFGKTFFKRFSGFFGTIKVSVSGEETSVREKRTRRCASVATLVIPFGVSSKKYSGHCGTQFIGACSKNAFIDSGNEGRGRHVKMNWLFLPRFFWKIIRIFAHHFIFSIITGNFYRIIFINIKSKWLLSNIF